MARLASGSHCVKNTDGWPSNVALAHKTANILDKMPKSVQGRVKQLIHEMYLSPTRKAALAAYDQFIASYQAKYPKATECLEKRQRMAVHLLRLSCPTLVASAHDQSHGIDLCYVRLRTQRSKGCGSRIATLTMVFKLATQAQEHWRRLNGSELIPKVVTGVIFVDEEELTQQAP
jgi:putative transposase